MSNDKAKDYKNKLRDIVALLEKERADNATIMEQMQKELEQTRRQLKRRKHRQQGGGGGGGGEEFIKMKEIYVSLKLLCFVLQFSIDLFKKRNWSFNRQRER